MSPQDDGSGSAKMAVSGQASPIVPPVPQPPAPVKPPAVFGAKIPPHTPQSGEPLLWGLQAQMNVEAALAGAHDMNQRIDSGQFRTADVSAIALLAAGGLAAVVLPPLGGKAELDFDSKWLAETGGEALKNWVVGWIADRTFGRAPDILSTWHMAHDLDKDMHTDTLPANIIEFWLGQIGLSQEVVGKLSSDRKNAQLLKDLLGTD